MSEWTYDEETLPDQIIVSTQELYAWAHAVWKDGWVKGTLGGTTDANPFRER